MLEGGGLRQFYLRAALVLTYTFCIMLGAAIVMLHDGRSFDARFGIVIATLALGAMAGSSASLALFYRLRSLPKILLAALMFVSVMFLTLLAQSIIHAGLLYSTTFLETEPVGSLYWFLELGMTLAKGAFLFLMFGIRLVLPVGLLAAPLFALGCLTLGLHESKT